MDTGDPQTTKKIQRTGFLTGKFKIPDDFDQVANAEIEELFDAGGIGTGVAQTEPGDLKPAQSN
jgi:hypothetical protein